MIENYRSLHDVRLSLAAQLAVGKIPTLDEWEQIGPLFNRHCSSFVHVACDNCIEFNTIELYTLDMPQESYKLHLDAASGEISIYYSHLQGLQSAFITLRHLFSSRSSVCTHAFTSLDITDGPVSPWRGLMVDVARHFIPVHMLKRSIDAMELARFNVLHLHLTDSQSFPLLLDDVVVEETPVPLSNLAKLGAFGADKIYTKEQMKDIVDYAARCD